MTDPGAPVEIQFTYDGDPIGDGAGGKQGVIFDKTTFTQQMNAIPGEFAVYVRDPEVGFDFRTGKEIVALENGVPIAGGFITQISKTHLFPDFLSPTWVLRGIDWNILFEKRVIHTKSEDPAAWVKHLPSMAGSSYDGDVIRKMVTDYADMDGFDDTSGIEDILPSVLHEDGSAWPEKRFVWPQQGSKIREIFDNMFAPLAAAQYFFAPDKRLIYRPFDEALKNWGFSDDPDPDADPPTYGFREMEATVDGSAMVNDAIIWGGSEFAGAGTTFYYRKQDSASISAHGRWQWAEANLGQPGYKLPGSVKARAIAIVDGVALGTSPTPEINISNVGQKNEQWQLHFAWHGHRVPERLVPGDIVPITLSLFGETRRLPLRSVTISFPTLDGVGDDAGKAYVRYEGDFSLSISDPWSLWHLLLKAQNRRVRPYLGHSQDGSTTTAYGGYGNFTPTNVSGLVYKLPFGYIPGSLLVYEARLLLVPKVDFDETDPEAGTFTLHASPSGGLYATCRTLSS